MRYALGRRYTLIQDLVFLIIFENDEDDLNDYEGSINDAWGVADSKTQVVSLDDRIHDARLHSQTLMLPSLCYVFKWISWLDETYDSQKNSGPVYMYITKSNSSSNHEAFIHKSDLCTFNPTYLSAEALAVYLLCCWQIRSLNKSVQEALDPFRQIIEADPVHQIATYAPFKWWDDTTKGRTTEVLLHKPTSILGDINLNHSLDLRIDTWEDIIDSLEVLQNLQGHPINLTQSFSKLDFDSETAESVTGELATIRSAIVCEHEECSFHTTSYSSFILKNSNNHLIVAEKYAKTPILVILTRESDSIQCLQVVHAEDRLCSSFKFIKLSDVKVDDDIVFAEQFVRPEWEKRAWMTLLRFLRCFEDNEALNVIQSNSPDLPLWICVYFVVSQNLSIKQALARFNLCYSSCGPCTFEHTYLLKRWQSDLYTLRGKHLRRVDLKSYVVNAWKGEHMMFREKMRDKIRAGRLWKYDSQIDANVIEYITEEQCCLSCDIPTISTSAREAQRNKKRPRKDLRSRRNLPQRNNVEVEMDGVQRKPNIDALCRFLNPVNKVTVKITDNGARVSYAKT